MQESTRQAVIQAARKAFGYEESMGDVIMFICTQVRWSADDLRAFITALVERT